MLFKFFATLISLVKTNFFSLWTSYLFILPFLMPKVFWHTNIFLTSALLRNQTLLRLAELVLTLNCFTFGYNLFQQTNGVPWVPKWDSAMLIFSYANLFEHQFFSQYNGPKPQLYGRYVDDCIGATSSSREELTQFITAVNSFHPALKYTWEISDNS